jgi:hypothetical protein
MKEVLNQVWISRTPALLTITWRRRVMRANAWFGETWLFLLGLCFLVVPLLSILTAIRHGRYTFKWVDLAALPFVLLGALLVTRTITLFTNTDRVEVTPQALKIRSGPLPAWDAIYSTLPVSTIRCVEAKDIISHSRGVGRGGAGVSVTYTVVVTLANGKTKTLIGGSTSAEPIFFIANEISRYLNSFTPPPQTPP